MKQKPVFVPRELVSLDFTSARRSFHYCQSTDGLASGNCLLEAVIHGLCERVERDATELWRFQRDAGVEARCVDPAVFADSGIDWLAERIAAANFVLRLFNVTSDIGLPVFMATISPATQHATYLHFDLAAGYGCHLSPRVAAMRAITEAAQTRITNISGARDDFDPSEYHQRLAPDLSVYIHAQARRSLAVRRARTAFARQSRNLSRAAAPARHYQRRCRAAWRRGIRHVGLPRIGQ